MSEESFDIQETEMLIRQRNTSGTGKLTQNGHIVSETNNKTVSPQRNGHIGPVMRPVTSSTGVNQGVENGDSGVVSIVNGDLQESLGNDGAQHQLINIS